LRLAAIFSQNNSDQASQEDFLQLLHTIPGGLWEMSIGMWLIAKGFNSSAFVSRSEEESDK
jgi:hypothetical protein